MRSFILKSGKSSFQMLLLFVILILTSVQAKSEEPAWLWAISAQGSDRDVVASLATDSEGNIYATGGFRSSVLDFGSITFEKTGSDFNYFLAKFTSEGEIVWGTTGEGGSTSTGGGVAVDQDGNIIVVGSFVSPSITLGDFTLINQGSRDMFLAKYSPSGEVLWATHAGSDDWDYAYDLVVDNSGNIYIAGRFISSSLTFGSETIVNDDGGEDIFVVKYNSEGEALWARSVGGPGNDYAWDIATDQMGNVYVAGHLGSPEITFGSTTLQNQDGLDVLLLKYDTDGNEIWARSASGSGSNIALAVTADASGNVYLGGYFSAESLDFGGAYLNNPGISDAFITKYDGDGNVNWAVGIGSEGRDGINDLTADDAGNILVVGDFRGPGVNIGSVFLQNSGERDLFIAQFDPLGNPLWAKSAGGPSDDRSLAVTIDATGNIYFGGLYESTTITMGSQVLTNDDGQYNLYISKLDGGAIGAPQSLSATALSGSSVELLWEANSDNDAVLIAYSNEVFFGLPEDGQTYNAGDILPGGGEVLYFGQAESTILHTGLEALTQYYYRAWSFNNGYSNAQPATTKTLCPDGYPLPFSEDFDGDPELPVCWSVEGTNVSLANNWKVGTFSNGLTHSEGNYVWVNMLGNALRTATLISPSFDFGGLNNIEVSFKHLYRHAHADAIFAFTTDGGNTWQTLETWSSNTGNATYSEQLDVLAGLSGVQFGWILQTRGTGPNRAVRSWSVDDIQISATPAGATYTIFADAAQGGSITPSGSVQVGEGSDQTFSIQADNGFVIADVLVDNVSVGAVNSYTFANVVSDHTIFAVFEQLPVVTYVITADAGIGGSIDPSGEVVVQQGDDQTFNFFPGIGFVVSDVVVDNVSLGVLSSYTFTNISSDHDIFVSFDVAPEDPCVVTVLPYLQDFNAVANIPECWSGIINEGNTGWSVGSFGGGLNGTTGNYAYFTYQGNQTQNADLVSPSFDFSGYSNINLSFTHFHNANRSAVGVYYSLDNGNNWVAIQTWNNSTNNPASFNQDLSFLAGQSGVIFRWNMDFSGGGPPRNSRSWSVDDIVVTGNVNQQNNASTPNMDNQGIHFDELNITLYPNPVSDILNIHFNNAYEAGLIIINDIQGRQVYYEKISNATNGQLLQIEIGHWRSGTYIVSFIGSGAVVNRIILKR